MNSRIRKLVCLLLAAALLLGTLPAVSAAGPAPAHSDLTAQALKLLKSDRKSILGKVYFLLRAEYLDAYYATSDFIDLSYTSDNSKRLSSDCFFVSIFDGTIDSLADDAEPIDIYYTFHTESFMNCNFDPLPAGDYTAMCFVTDEEGNIYDFSVFAHEFHVRRKPPEPADFELYEIRDGQVYDPPKFLPLEGRTHFLTVPTPEGSRKPVFRTIAEVTSPYATGAAFAGYPYITTYGSDCLATLTVRYGNIRKEFVFMVGDVTSLSAEAGATALCPGQTDTIVPSVTPKNKPIIAYWESTDPSVITVEDGLVTAVAPGEASVILSVGSKQCVIDYTVHPHQFPEGTPVVPRTATKYSYSTGDCALCGAEGCFNYFEAPLFRDTKPYDWYSDHVDFVWDNGIMNGTGTGNFSPNNPMSRAMVATVFYRMEGEPEVTGGSVFSDIPEGQWYTDGINWAAECGIVTGYPDGTFRPNTLITREQFATILFRYTSKKNVEMKPGADIEAFPDSGTVLAYAVEGMRWAIAEGLINGIASGGVTKLSPRSNTTRAQFATVISRYMNTEWIPLPPEAAESTDESAQ